MMAEMGGTSLNLRKKRNWNKILTITLLVIVVNQVMRIVVASYVPYGRRGKTPAASMSSDQEEDDMDQNASAPYQRGENNGGDGYEENEPDGPYDETPREAEGQADMEKFFDDHLGASERDGMDKENLPTNLRPKFIASGESPVIGPMGLIDETRGSSPASVLSEPLTDGPRYDTVAPVARRVDRNYLDNPRGQEGASGYANLSAIDRKVALNGGDFGRDLSSRQQDSTNNIHRDEVFAETKGSPRKALPRRDANGSEILAIEDEDMDKIYVTNMTNRPFRIDALGGYDPEEDFQAASRDIEEPGNVSLPRGGSGRAVKRRANGGGGRVGSGQGEEEEPPSAKDITFSDPEADTLFNDASETDEVTFGRDDPYQIDFEAEILGKTTVKPVRRKDTLGDLDYDSPEEGGTNFQSRRSGNNDDDSDSGWVNDGVDDMDVPSQAYQDSVLDKAAKRQALAERNAAADNGPSQQDDNNPEENVNQQMPNADYMKDDLTDVGVKKAR